MEPFLNPAQTIADLRNAVTILETEQWHQGEDYEVTPEGVRYFCAFGAVRMAVGDIDITRPDRFSLTTDSRDRAANAGRAFYRIIGCDMVTYNDTEGRTKNQMVRAMQTVIASLEEDPRRA